MHEYLLPAHVYCCRRGDAYVFLDLRQDDYILVTGAAADALRALADLDRSATANDPLHELEEGGLLTKNPTMGRSFATTDIDLAIEPLVDTDAVSPTPIRAADWWNFAAACTTAAVRLRWHRLETTVAAVAKRKALHGARTRVDMAKARHFTAVFNRLRSFFPANYLCLFDSLALIEFLARYDVFPTWVFGVKLEPWAAHCWIQHEQFAFNEEVEHAASYTPIMAI